MSWDCGEQFHTLLFKSLEDFSGEFCEMWANLVVSVTLLPMLVHSIFGCCWHHAHSGCSLPFEHSTSESHAGHRHAHDQSRENNDPVVPRPCEHDESCDDVHCAYLAAEPVRNVLAFDLQSQVTELHSCCILILNPAATASRNSQLRHEAPASSQRRALTQVWIV